MGGLKFLTEPAAFISSKECPSEGLILILSCSDQSMLLKVVVAKAVFSKTDMHICI